MTGNNVMFVLGSFVAACSVKVARLPMPGESLCADAFIVEAGGKGLNIAAGAHRLGAKVDGLLAIGDDFLSSLAKAAIKNLGLPATMLLEKPGQTGAGVGFIEPAGENCLAVFSGANAMLSAGDVAAAAERISKARVLVTQFEISDGPIKAAFAKVRQAECVSILNPSPYRAIDAQILANTDIIILNRIEAQQIGYDIGLTYHPTNGNFLSYLHPLAVNLMDRGPGIIIVTLGDEGAFAWRRGYESYHQPAFKVDAVDTLGAGDAFTAGFGTCLVEQRPFEDCLRWGAASGAWATTRFGVLDALPRRAALEMALSQWVGCKTLV